MTSVEEHYDTHLAAVYSWMLGDFADAVAAERIHIEDAGISRSDGGVAIDLGAGPGVHTIALADMGYRVTAIDSCASLVQELEANAGTRDVRSVLGDLTAFVRLAHVPADAIVCMGDTLTHLSSLAVVNRLFRDVAAALRPGGVFVATFRDYSGPGPEGKQRFIPVRSDERRILTCFLDYQDDVVLVHDILQERDGDGWTTSVSAYPKLRISPDWALGALTDAGLVATLGPAQGGMVRLVGRL